MIQKERKNEKNWALKRLDWRRFQLTRMQMRPARSSQVLINFQKEEKMFLSFDGWSLIDIALDVDAKRESH